MRPSWLLLVLLATAGAGEPPPFAGFRQTFSYVPARDGVGLQPGGAWQPRFATEHRPKGGDNVFNGEFQFYADPGYPWSNGYSPFALAGGALRIRAERTTGARFAPGEIPDDPATGQPYPWVSGVLTTRPSFAQHGGYFEVDAKLPRGQGTWPAFWLLPIDERHPPEIDVVEYRGDRPGQYHLAALSRPARNDLADVPAGQDLSLDFHRYGVLWTDTALVFMLDRRPVAVKDISASDDFRQPFYLLLNLAIGSRGLDGFVPPPDATTPSPADMLVRSVTAWQRPGPTGVTLSASAVPGTARPGSLLAHLGTEGTQAGPVAFAILDDPGQHVAVHGADLVVQAPFDPAARRNNPVTIRATDRLGRAWQQRFTLVALDMGQAESLYDAGWTADGVQLAPAGDAVQLAEDNSAQRRPSISTTAPVPSTAAHLVLRGDFKPAGRHWLMAEVASADRQRTLKVFFDVETGRIGNWFSAPANGPAALRIERPPLAVRGPDGFMRCEFEFSAPGAGPLRTTWWIVADDDEEEAGHTPAPGAGVLARNLRLIAAPPE